MTEQIEQYINEIEVPNGTYYFEPLNRRERSFVDMAIRTLYKNGEEESDNGGTEWGNPPTSGATMYFDKSSFTKQSLLGDKTEIEDVTIAKSLDYVGIWLFYVTK